MLRWSVLLAVLGLAACGSDGRSSATGAPACVPGEQAACACPGGAEGAQVCRDDGSGFGACQGCPSGQGGSGAGTSTSGGGAGQGGSGGAPAPECETDEDCAEVMADELEACGLPAPRCHATCVGGPQICKVYGPYVCGSAFPCPAPPVCHQVECVFAGTTSSCVVSPVPDGTSCTPGGTALCEGGVCDP